MLLIPKQRILVHSVLACVKFHPYLRKRLVMQTSDHVRKRVMLSNIKKFAIQGLPRSPLRDDILSQPDELSAEEFLASARVWLRLARAG